MTQSYNSNKKSKNTNMPGTWEILKKYLLTDEKEKLKTEKRNLFRTELRKPFKSKR